MTRPRMIWKRIKGTSALELVCITLGPPSLNALTWGPITLSITHDEIIREYRFVFDGEKAE